MLAGAAVTDDREEERKEENSPDVVGQSCLERAIKLSLGSSRAFRLPTEEQSELVTHVNCSFGLTNRRQEPVSIRSFLKRSLLVLSLNEDVAMSLWPMFLDAICLAGQELLKRRKNSKISSFQARAQSDRSSFRSKSGIESI